MNVKFVYSDLVTNFPDGNVENYLEDVKKSIERSRTLSLETFFLDGETLYDSTYEELHNVLWCCQLVKDLRISVEPSRLVSINHLTKDINNKLSYIVQNEEIYKLSLDFKCGNEFNSSLLKSILNPCGFRLKILILQSCTLKDQILIPLVSLSLEKCPNLEVLRIKLKWSSDETSISEMERNLNLN